MELAPALMSLAVITPTTGRDLGMLRGCVASVRAALDDLALSRGICGHHYVVLDREAADAEFIRGQVFDRNNFIEASGASLVTLPHATGAGGWNGHRIYAAMGWLVPQTHVAFLDEDNLVHPGHYAGLFAALASVPGARWAHSLRTVVGPDGASVPDACESLGLISHSTLGPNDVLVDVSCYLLETALARDLSGLWNARARDPARTEVDRALATVLCAECTGAVSRRHSLYYRTGSRPDSVQLEFFRKNNAVWGLDFGDSKRGDLYVFWMHPAVSEAIVQIANPARGEHGPGVVYAEWNVAQARELARRFNVLDGYSNARRLPHGAMCLVALCFPEPVEALGELFRKRGDLKVAVYTAEGPNILHKRQWTRNWLENRFGPRPRLLTYFAPLLRAPWAATTFVPHNCHHYTREDLLDPRLLAEFRPASSDRSVVMVLEPRAGCATYEIDGTDLRQLDYLRRRLVSGLEVTVIGRGWAAAAREVGVAASARWTVVETGGKQADVSSFDRLSNFQFAIVLENTDAPGYVSEKLYDCLAAGCIPLFYDAGNTHAPELEFLRTAGCFLDISQCQSGTDVQALLDALTDNDIEALQRRVAETRPAILRAAGAEAFADALERALAPAANE